jgi:DNA-binding MarR family transcriptional regulator
MGRARLRSFPPLTVSRKQLLDGGQDTEFRELVDNLMRFSTHIQAIREGLARRMGVTQPQYNILLAVAHLSSDHGAMIGEISRYMNVTEPFIVEETRKLVVAELLEKRGSATDRRRVQIHLTKAGKEAVKAIAPVQRQVNDMLFGTLARADFKALNKIMRSLLACSPSARGIAYEGLTSTPRNHFRLEAAGVRDRRRPGGTGESRHKSGSAR